MILSQCSIGVVTCPRHGIAVEINNACEDCIADRPTRAPKLWPGERVVILGGGCSLTPEDVEFCRGKARVIAIKEAYLLAPWADVLYACDAKFWRFYDGAQTFTGLKYTIEQDPAQEQHTAWPGVHILKNTGQEGLELDPSGLRTGYNSGYQAVNLAVHLAGPTEIVLLGFDMWSGPNGQNWFGPHPNHVDSPYPIFLQAFQSLVEPLKAAGVRVVNSSRVTVMNSFPRVPLEEALA